MDLVKHAAAGGLSIRDIPNLTFLRQFVVIAEEGGISRAARRLRISQPALSKNMRRLEAMLGSALFERHSSGVELTRAGRIFLDRARAIGLEYQVALEDIRNLIADQESTIRLGVGPVWSVAVLPQVAKRFHQLYPSHRLLVSTGPMDKLGEDLRLGKTDLFAGALIPSTMPAGFTCRTILDSEMVIFASQDHEIIKAGGKADPAKLAEYPFVAFEPSSGVLETLSSFLHARGAPPPRFMLESSSLLTCVELVRNGDYLMYETRMLARARIGRDLAIVPVGQQIEGYQTGIVHREGLERIARFDKLILIMTEVLKDTTASATC